MKIENCKNCECEFGQTLDDAAFGDYAERFGLCDSCRESVEVDDD